MKLSPYYNPFTRSWATSAFDFSQIPVMPEYLVTKGYLKGLVGNVVDKQFTYSNAPQRHSWSDTPCVRVTLEFDIDEHDNRFVGINHYGQKLIVGKHRQSYAIKTSDSVDGIIYSEFLHV